MSDADDLIKIISSQDLRLARLLVFKGLTMDELEELGEAISDHLPSEAFLVTIPVDGDVYALTDADLEHMGLQRIPSSGVLSEQLLPDEDRGIYRKYRVQVQRVDGRTGPGQKHEHCEFFILDLDHDLHALPALDAYARACEGEYPFLAEHIRAKLRRAVAVRDGWTLPDAPVCPYHSMIMAVPTVYNGGDGWAIGWSSSCCGPDPFQWDDGGPGVGEQIEWPFKVHWARAEDWTRLGFLVA